MTDTLASTIQNMQPSAATSQNTQNPLNPQPHAPRTHTSPAIIQLLKNLSLPNILQKNKGIEAENDARSAKTLNNALDPVAHPQPGSEVASLITIDPEDLARLRVPSFFASVRDFIYNSLARHLADEELREKEEKKRKDDVILPEDARVSKRRCMDGSNHVERVVGEPIPIEFPQSLYDTEICVAVPLPFFLTRNLQSLVDEASTLPTVKSNPAPGETKGTYILNIEKLSTRFGKELTLTCSQWSEAAANMWSFQISRDKLGSEGEHASWFEKHFNFFNMLNKRDELYDAWKVMELEFRQDHCSRHLKFSAMDYDKVLGLTEESHKLRKEFQDFVNSSQMGVGRSGSSYHGSVTPFSQRVLPRGPSNSQAFSQPFLPGSSKSSPSAVCLICVYKGHTIFFHLKATSAKFADGKAVWAKCSQGSGLTTLTTRPFASTGMFRVLMLSPNVLPSTRTTDFTSVPSVAAKVTTPSLGLAAPSLSEDFLTVVRPPSLSYTDFSLSVVPRPSLAFSTTEHSSIFERTPHPYNSDAFDFLLSKHGLTPAYPLLSKNLRHGFPLGHMPALVEPVILPNNPSTYPYMREIQDYLQKELLAGRMSGPFSCEEAEAILCGPFFSSPLVVDVQPKQPGMPDKIRICRHLSKASKSHPSVNSHIRKEDFLTCFDLASKVAEIVSLLPSFPSPLPLSSFLLLHTPLCLVWGMFSSLPLCAA